MAVVFERIADGVVGHIVVDVGHAAFLKATGRQRACGGAGRIPFFFNTAMQYFKYASAIRVSRVLWNIHRASSVSGSL